MKIDFLFPVFMALNVPPIKKVRILRLFLKKKRHYFIFSYKILWYY